MIEKEYAVVGITKEEFFGGGSDTTTFSVMKALEAAWQKSMSAVPALRARGEIVGKTVMEVLARDSFAEGE